MPGNRQSRKLNRLRSGLRWGEINRVLVEVAKNLNSVVAGSDSCQIGMDCMIVKCCRSDSLVLPGSEIL
jgi:hypothetical protein